MDFDTQEILSSGNSSDSEQLIPNGHCSQVRVQKKCPPHFSYRLVKNPQKGALFIAIANIFYCMEVLTLSSRSAKENQFYGFSPLYYYTRGKKFLKKLHLE